MAETNVPVPGAGGGPYQIATFGDKAGNQVQMVNLVDGSGNGDDVIGDLSAAAPASDTAAASLNGRLQRIAQRITSLIGLLPAALGAGGGLKVDGSGTALPISATALPLPAGAAQEAGGNLAAILAKLNGSVAVSGTFWQTTQPISVASLPLPAGAATATGQAAIITALGSPFQAGGAIANTQFGATQVGSWSVSLTGSLPALAAGSAIVGKVGIDQTTPGTTNGVVVNNGSSGLDYSANQPTLPNVGANFAASGPYASYVLIKTIPASAARNNVDIQNTSGAQIAVIRDDGTAGSGVAPNNASVFALAGGSAAGAQGGAWSSQTFKGRLQIYAPSGAAQVAAMVD